MSLGLVNKALTGLLWFMLQILGVCIFVGFPVMWLWNWLIPELFGLSTIAFWQAVGLTLLVQIVFPSNLFNDDSKDHRPAILVIPKRTEEDGKENTPTP